MDKITYFQKIEEYKLLAKHELGQNFLLDYDAAERIVDLLDEKEGERVLEIGFGVGSLSFFLSQKEGQADLIDVDEGFLVKLQEDFKNSTHVKPIYGNATKWDYSPYRKIIGNLPYYITSLILEKAFLGGENCQKMVFMVQKEAAARILANVGSKEYGPLHVLWRLLYDGKREFNVPRTSFAPAPHVDSSVVSFTRREGASIVEATKAFELASSMFLQRRKTILNNLKNYLHDADKARAVLHKCGILETARPETITPAQYLSLCKAINE